MRARGLFAVLLAVVVGLSPALATAESPKGAPYPADPLASHYEPPRARELGVTARQLRVFLGGGAAYVHGPQLGLQATIEFTTLAFLGIRITSPATITRFTGDGPGIWGLQIGPALHLLPYRRVDFGLFFEAGPAWVHQFGAGASAWMARMSAGGSLAISLSTYWFLLLEGSLAVGVHAREGAAVNYLAPGGLLAVGIQI